MPLERSSSAPAFKRNVSTLMKEVGHSPHVNSRAQALAVAYSIQRRNKGRDAGGPVTDPVHAVINALNAGSGSGGQTTNSAMGPSPMNQPRGGMMGDAGLPQVGAPTTTGVAPNISTTQPVGPPIIATPQPPLVQTAAGGLAPDYSMMVNNQRNSPQVSAAGIAPPVIGSTPNIGTNPADPVAIGGVRSSFSQGGVPNLAFGGLGTVTTPKMTVPWQEKQEARNLTKGPILSNVPGRTDAHKTHVPSGSYVIPADIVSGRGQGNTIAGAHALQKLFKMGPYGAGMPALMRGHGMPRVGNIKAPKMADGGAMDPTIGQPVRVNLAGGEIVVPPENLMEVVHPNLKHAHSIMDAWVLHERKNLRNTLAKLPGPVIE